MGSIPIFGIFIIILMFFFINFISSSRPMDWQLGFQYPATAIMEGIINFHHDLFFFIIIIIVFTYYMLVRCVILYKDTKNNKKRVPINIIHAPILEIIWTLIPAFILFLIALPSFSLLYSMDEMEESFTTVKVIGNQWYWTYELEDPNYCIPIFYNREQEILAKDSPILMYNKLKYCRIAFEKYWQKTHPKEIETMTVNEQNVLMDNDFAEMLLEKKEKLLKFKVITEDEINKLQKPKDNFYVKHKITEKDEEFIIKIKEKWKIVDSYKKNSVEILEDMYLKQDIWKPKPIIIKENPLLYVYIPKVKNVPKKDESYLYMEKAQIPLMYQLLLPKAAEEFRRFVEDEIEHRNFVIKFIKKFFIKLLHFIEIFNQKIDAVLNYTGIRKYKEKKFTNIRTTFDSYMIPTEDLVKRKLRLLDVDNKLYLPTMVNIKILITSSDVLHSWAVPSFGIKLDSVPGRLNQTSLKIRTGGFYYGQCSEICGINHAFMPIVVGGVPFLQKNFKIEMSQDFFNAIYPMFMHTFYKK